MYFNGKTINKSYSNVLLNSKKTRFKSSNNEDNNNREHKQENNKSKKLD